MTIMKFKKIGLFLIAILFVVVSVATAGVSAKDRKAHTQGTTDYNNIYRLMLINNVTSYYSNNGDGSYDPFSSDDEGFEYPKGSQTYTIFEEGLVWAGVEHAPWDTIQFNSSYTRPIHVGGSTYNHGLQTGRIVTPGDSATATWPVAQAASAATRIYRVRPDIGPSTDKAAALALLTTTEIPYFAHETYSAEELYDQYIADWNEWPATSGAPYKDVNGNGVYDPGTDIPGVPGADQTIWYVANDMDVSVTYDLAGSSPMGIEFQRTIWAYNQSGALGNTIFQKNLIINKSGVSIDSLYLSQWSDPDLGGSLGANDDYVGCDTSLGLGFVYNATNSDGAYGSTPPAVGFDFLEGPMVDGAPTDVAIFKGQKVTGKKNLGMTAFNFFVNQNSTYIDPRLGSTYGYVGTTDWWNLMRGLVTRTGATYTNPITNQVTQYCLSGDPVTSSGWIDGKIAGAGDRRMCQITGPFTLKNGDTTEVVVGELVAEATNRLSSVAMLRYYDLYVQNAYDNFFNIPSSPTAPTVQTVALNKQVVLDWSDSASAAKVEAFTSAGYKFEGYNVYQLPSNSFSSLTATRLATYDLVDGVGYIEDLAFDATEGLNLTKPVQKGTDSGLKRYYSATTDAIKGVSLVNGNTYYFAVTAYSYNLSAFPKTMESAPVIYAVTPESNKPGVQYNTSVGTDLGTTSNAIQAGSPLSDGALIANVVNPEKLTGDVYKVTFSTVGSTKTWSLVDTTTHVTKISNSSKYASAASTVPDSTAVIDGIQFGVYDPGASGGIAKVVLVQDSATVLSTPRNMVRNTSPDGTWGLDVAGSTSSATFLSRLNWQSAAGSYDYEFRFTSAASGSQYYVSPGGALSSSSVLAANRIKLQVWNITTNTQLLVNVLDDDGSGTYTASNGGFTSTLGSPYDRIYVSNAFAYAEPLPSAPSTVDAASTELLSRLAVVDVAGTGAFPSAGSVIRVITNKPIVTGVNAFVLNTSSYAKTTNNTELAKQQVEKISIWPNPYFGFNKNETDRYNRFVQMNHLPARATIRVFNLGGILVRTILKDDATQFAKWDLKNESGLPVAAGVYIVYVDMPDLNKTKTLKVSIIPETQYLDRY
jgi:hypothetical protein